MDDTALGQLGDRARVLNDLKQTEGWQELRRIHDARRDDYVSRIASRILKSRDPIDQPEIDRMRGFLAGMKYLLDSADHAEETFEAAVRRATKPGSDHA